MTYFRSDKRDDAGKMQEGSACCERSSRRYRGRGSAFELCGIGSLRGRRFGCIRRGTTEESRHLETDLAP